MTTTSSTGTSTIRPSRAGVPGWGAGAILLAAVGYGVSTSVSVAALDDVRPADLLSVELGGAAVALLVLGAATGRLRRARALRHLLLGGLMPGLAFALGDLGLARTSASSGSLLLAVDSLFTVGLAVLVLKERIGRTAGLALALGFAGAVLVASASAGGGGGTQLLGNVLVVASVAASAVFVVGTRRLGDEGGLNASAWQTTGGVLFASPFVATSWATGGSRLPHAGTAALVACLGVLVCTAVAGVAFNWGITRVSAGQAGQLFNLTPVAGLASAVLLLGERPAPVQLLGGLVVLGSLVLLVRGVPEDDPVASLPDCADLDPEVVAAGLAPCA